MDNLAVSMQGITKIFNGVKANDNVDFNLRKGSIHGLLGENGAGKTTLMNIIGCLDKPTSGTYELAGEDVLKLKDKQLSDLRLRSIGFVFQSFHLLPRQSAISNVEMPLNYAHVPKKERRERAFAALDRVGLADRVDFRPNQLSGGQMQRVAIARAIVNNPRLLLADEPTGALDSRSSDELLALFSAIHQSGQTIVMVTHSTKAAASAGRVMFIKDGEVFHQLYRGNDTNEQFYQRISDTLTLLTTGGEAR